MCAAQPEALPRGRWVRAGAAGRSRRGRRSRRGAGCARARCALVGALDLIERVRGYPALAHGVVEDRPEDVAVGVARLRCCRRDEHPRRRRATRDDPAFGFEVLRGRVGDPLGALGVQRDHAVSASAPVLPGAGQLVGEAHGLVLGRDLDGGAAGRLRRPAGDLAPLRTSLPSAVAFGRSSRPGPDRT